MYQNGRNKTHREESASESVEKKRIIKRGKGGKDVFSWTKGGRKNPGNVPFCAVMEGR